MKFAVIRHGNAARLFGYRYGKRIALLGYAHCGTVAQTEVAWNIFVVRNGKNAACRRNAMVGNYHGSVVERTVLEKNVFYEALLNFRVYYLTRFFNVAKPYVAFVDYESPYFLRTHGHARPDNGNDAVFAYYIGVLGGSRKKVDYLAYGVLGSERGEEVTDVFLKDYDECNGTNVHGFVHYGAEETHVENLRNEYPHYYEYKNSHEDVSGARLFH